RRIHRRGRRGRREERQSSTQSLYLLRALCGETLDPFAPEARMPSVSVIVPVRNEATSIEPTLRSLLTQDFPRGQFEVIVADGAPTDDTVPVVRRLQGEFPNLKLVYNPGRF